MPLTSRVNNHVIITVTSCRLTPRDVLSMKGDKVKQPIAITNLNDALTYAEQVLKDRWEWYKEQYKKGVKR